MKDKLKELLKDKLLSIKTDFNETTIEIEKNNLVELLNLLKNSELKLDFLTDLTCVDFFSEKPRFEMVYHLFSTKNFKRLRVKCRVEENNPEIDSLCSIWMAASFMEREVYDLYGIKFINHPDLRRILLYDEFIGHPLRKDYPVDKEQPLVNYRDRDKNE